MDISLLPSLGIVRFISIICLVLLLLLIYLTYKKKPLSEDREEESKIRAQIKASKRQIKRYKKK